MRAQIMVIMVALAVALGSLPASLQAGPVSPHASMISTLRTEPTLVTGEAVEVNVWLMDAAGNLQDQVRQPVYVWVTSTDQPGVMRPVLDGGQEMLVWETTGGRIQKQPLRIWQSGTYTVHAALTPPTAATLAAGTLAELDRTDTHPITVYSGRPMPVLITQTLPMIGTAPPDVIDVPLGGDGVAVSLTLTGADQGRLPAGHTVTATTSGSGLDVQPSHVQTDSQGSVAFRLYGHTAGTHQLTLRVLGMERNLTVEVGRPQAVYFMNRTNAILNDRSVELDAVPRIINQRAYVPFRSLAEAFGGQVVYDDGVITTTLQDRTVVMTVGAQTYTVNGIAHTMDATPRIDPTGERTLIPVRFAAEGLGLRVSPLADASGATMRVIVTPLLS